MSIIERVKRMLSRKPESFVERPKAQTAERPKGRTRTAHIGRHRRIQVGLVDLANVCPVCAGRPIRLISSTRLIRGSDSPVSTLYECANKHTWAN